MPTTIQQQLSAIANLMQSAQFAAARNRLEAFIRTNQSVPQAYWLLGGARQHTGDLAGAEVALRSGLQLAPDDVRLLALLGEVLIAAGRPGEAEPVLRRALSITPDEIHAAASLTELLLAQRRAEEALQVANEHARRAGRTPGVLLLRARCLLAAERQTEAIPAFEAALAMAPDNPTAELGLAAALGDDGQYVASEREVSAAMRHGFTAAPAHFVLARALLGQRRLDEAETEFRAAIQLQPDYEQAHINLAETMWMRTGDAPAVIASIDASLRALPGLPTLRLSKAKLLEATGDIPAALRELDTILARDDHNAAAHIAAAQAALKVDGACALRHAERAYRMLPDSPLALAIFGNALLSAGHIDAAETFVNRMLAQNPDDGLALALQATVWHLRGDSRYFERCDYASFVRVSPIDTPSGWPNLTAYLDDLTNILHRRHVYCAHPIAQSLRNGSQTDLFLDRDEDAIVRAFGRAIDGPIHAYMAALCAGSDPVRRRNTGAYRISGAWSVRLHPHGYHINHYHPDGWLSSACYIDLPADMGQRGGEGWLEFGAPSFPTTPVLAPDYCIKPAPGLLALFPAWLWHGTVPFSGAPDESRLTIAFDVVPA